MPLEVTWVWNVSLLDLPVKMSKMCPCPLLLVWSVNAVAAFFLQRATTTSVYAVIMKFGTGFAKQTHTHTFPCCEGHFE